MSKYFPDQAGIFCLAVFSILLIKSSDFLLPDSDTFWHIKVGDTMLKNRSILDRDIFSHTSHNSPWTAHEWLSEVIMAGVNNMAGNEGLLCLFTFIISITFWLLYKVTEQQSNSYIALFCVAGALAFSPSHMAARPHMFTWFLMTVTIALLTSGGKKIFWLPVVMLLWANLHGGFILGLVLQFLFVAGSTIEMILDRKPTLKEYFQQHRVPLGVLLVSIVIIGLNPFGYELLLFPFQVSKGVFSGLIAEWQAPDLQEMWYFRLYLIALVLLVSLPKSAANWTERLLIICFLNAALIHIRHVSLMIIGLAPFVAKMINNQIGVWRPEFQKNHHSKHIPLSPVSGPAVTAIITLVLIAAGSIDHRSLNFLSPTKIFNVEVRDLDQLVNFIEKETPQGKMFNEYTLGGYLIYALDPPQKVFIDGRADMYGEKILSDYHQITVSNSLRKQVLEQYEIDWVVYNRDSDLIKDLTNSGNWHRVYANNSYEVVIRGQQE